MVALVANRDYGLNVKAGQTQLAYPYGVMNKFGAGSIFKIFTAAAFLEKGGGINNNIKTPHDLHLAACSRVAASRCPSHRASADTRWYCLSNGEARGYPAQMTPAERARDLAEHRLRDPRGAGRHGQGRRHGEPARPARDDGAPTCIGQKPDPKADDAETAT